MRQVLTGLLAALALLCAAPRARAEDGYELWLRYRGVEAPWLQHYRAAARELLAPREAAGPAENELIRAITALLGVPPVKGTRVDRDGAILFGTPKTSKLIDQLHLDLDGLGPEGYVIRTQSMNGHRVTIIAANANAGVLYGVFHFLRLMQTRQSVDRLDLRTTPQLPVRMLDHWDNLDGTVERGYAGASIWDWHTLPDYLAPRYSDYARACASIGINASVLTNVNADAATLTPAYLSKAAALAGIFRLYGIKVYLTPKFTAPMELGGLATADPLDPAVRRWWQDKVAEIYRYIPDFGGFVVKANSEGQPGPQDYHRSHADGANLFADALAPHGGSVVWRAFVYSDHRQEDRVMQAYDDFAPLDGQFRGNVSLQIKNGALDFQPREPAHPLFGAMPKSQLTLEVQITKEYLGFATHLVYLGPLFQEVLSFDTYANGSGSPVRSVIKAIAGVSNVGAARNWTGSHFDQANWYAFGRLAWDPELPSRDIAQEWVRMTFSTDARFVEPTVAMMMGSREAAVDYMTPLGLAHLMAAGHHYGPGAWQGGQRRADWNPPYYHRADAQGIGFDRSASGSKAAAQYPKALADIFDDIKLTPERYLLWFHHVSWDHRLASGRTVWEELVLHYTHGVEEVHHMRDTWGTLAPYVDPERHAEVETFLAIQEKEAQWWRDATLAYFQSVSKRPFPSGTSPPARTLAEYESISVPYAPGNPGWTAAPFRH